jgi:hypothetical protein
MPLQFKTDKVDGHVWWFGTEKTQAVICWIYVKTPGRGEGSLLLRDFEEHVAKLGMKSVKCITVDSPGESAESKLIRLNFFQRNQYRFVKLECNSCAPSEDLFRFTLIKKL